MVGELLLFVIAGCIFGVVTGIVPGIHVNTIASLLLLFPVAGNEGAVALIVAMGITHSFVDFVPSIALGAPDSESFLAVLPGHRYLLRGKGYRALMLTVAGGFFGGILSLALAPFFFLFISKIEALLPNLIPFILVGVILLMVFSEEKGRRANTMAIIALCGALGIIALRGNIARNALVPMVIGFFAVSTLLYSLKAKPSLKRQFLSGERINWRDSFFGSILGVIAGSTVSLMPSIGPAQAAFLVKKFIGRIHTEQYLALLGAINTVNLIFSFFVLFALGKTRSGLAVALGEIILLEERHLLLISGAALAAMCFSVFATLFFGRKFLKKIDKLPYSKINVAVLLFLLLIVFFASGLIGLVVLATSTALGYYCVHSHVKRTNCMAFLMVPTILIYLGL